MSSPIYNNIQINRPIEQVFDFVTTPRNWPQWHPASVSVSGNADHSLRPGEEVTETICVLGYRGGAKWLVRERSAPHRWVIDGSGENRGVATITYTLTRRSEGTVFDRELVYTMPNPLFPLFDSLILRRRMKTDSAEALRCLKRLLESDREIN
ncbi:MAG TPA: SRPBCC family protein [Candidatus Binatia bacterium]|nr:SRPBCC family protein [Candidatus Binatia bacterium]